MRNVINDERLCRVMSCALRNAVAGEHMRAHLSPLCKGGDTYLSPPCVKGGLRGNCKRVKSCAMRNVISDERLCRVMSCALRNVAAGEHMRAHLSLFA